MDTAKVFRNGSSQAVRLPKKYRFEGQEVFVRKVGEAVILLPRQGSWRTLYEGAGEFSDDFMLERDQPEASDARPVSFD